MNEKELRSQIRELKEDVRRLKRELTWKDRKLKKIQLILMIRHEEIRELRKKLGAPVVGGTKKYD